MELFKVICVTCQARLSVRNEALIGQIVACPRCGSMVQVAPPAEAAAPPVVVAEVVAPAAESSTVPDFAPPEVTEPPVPAEVVPAESAAAEVATTAATSAMKYKLIAWSLASFVVGASLVGSFVLLRGSTEEPGELPQLPAEQPIAATQEPTEKDTAGTATAEPAESSEIPNSAEASPAVEAQQAASELAEPEVLAEAASHIAAEEEITPTEPADELDPGEVLVIEEAPQVAKRFDPLSFDLESLSLDALDQQPEETEAEQIVDASSDPPAEPTADEPPAIAAPPEQPAAEWAAEQDITTAEKVASDQLQLVVPAVEFEQLPLVDALQLFSQLGGVPMSVAPEQLLMAGITAEQPVALRAREQSIGRMLGDVLQPLRLEIQTDGPQVIVERRDARKTREINYPVEDLVASGTSEGELADWVQQLIAPSSWQAAGGTGLLEASSGQLRIKQTQAVQYQVLILLERLRLARELPPKSRYPVERLAGTPVHIALQRPLSKEATFTFLDPVPLQEVLAYWQIELGVPLLVDWPALAEIDVWPGTKLSCAMQLQPWDTALQRVLEPLGLGWRAATGGTIVISTAKRLQGQLQWELYPLVETSQANLDFLLGELESALRNQRLDVGKATIYDPAGNVLLVSQPAVGQRAVYRVLIEQNALRVQR